MSAEEDELPDGLDDLDLGDDLGDVGGDLGDFEAPPVEEDTKGVTRFQMIEYMNQRAWPQPELVALQMSVVPLQLLLAVLTKVETKSVQVVFHRAFVADFRIFGSGAIERDPSLRSARSGGQLRRGHHLPSWGEWRPFAHASRIQHAAAPVASTQILSQLRRAHVLRAEALPLRLPSHRWFS